MKNEYVGGLYEDVYLELKRICKEKKIKRLSTLKAIDDVLMLDIPFDMTPLGVFQKLEILGKVKLSKSYKTIIVR